MQQKILIKRIQYNSISNNNIVINIFNNLYDLPFDKERSPAKEKLMARWSAWNHLHPPLLGSNW
jgi:hypothetical protein